jgi:hypothetical protein
VGWWPKVAKAPLIKFSIEGADFLEAALRDLGGSKEIRRVLGKTLLHAAEPVARDARSRARRKSGRMAEGIDVSATLSRRQRADEPRPGPDEAQVFIGAKPIGPAVLEEFGTAERHWQSGKSTGAQPAHPFMRPAWEAGKGGVLERFGKELWVFIELEAKRIARKQAKLIRETGGGN